MLREISMVEQIFQKQGDNITDVVSRSSFILEKYLVIFFYFLFIFSLNLNFYLDM